MSSDIADGLQSDTVVVKLFAINLSYSIALILFPASQSTTAYLMWSPSDSTSNEHCFISSRWLSSTNPFKKPPRKLTASETVPSTTGLGFAGMKSSRMFAVSAPAAKYLPASKSSSSFTMTLLISSWWINQFFDAILATVAGYLNTEAQSSIN